MSIVDRVNFFSKTRLATVKSISMNKLILTSFLVLKSLICKPISGKVNLADKYSILYYDNRVSHIMRIECHIL